MSAKNKPAAKAARRHDRVQRRTRRYQVGGQWLWLTVPQYMEYADKAWAAARGLCRVGAVPFAGTPEGELAWRRRLDEIESEGEAA